MALRVSRVSAASASCVPLKRTETDPNRRVERDGVRVEVGIWASSKVRVGAVSLPRSNEKRRKKRHQGSRMGGG
jgi:hypothetical protein